MEVTRFLKWIIGFDQPMPEPGTMKIKNADGQWSDIPKVFPCPDCGHQVSTQAPVCPSCGRRLKTEQSAIGLLAAIIIGLGLAIALIWFASAVMQ